ncbi:DUF2516 family protein [Micrococcales bacterium 31B]|nr:DUF2516 family protein [Micrococcales bacterium 31B]
MFLITASYYLYLAVAAGAFVLSVLAAVNCIVASPAAFVVSGKRSKGFWLLLTLGSLLIATMGIYQAFIAAFGFGLFQALAAAVAGVYLADVKPEVSGPRRGSSW